MCKLCIINVYKKKYNSIYFPELNPCNLLGNISFFLLTFHANNCLLQSNKEFNVDDLIVCKLPHRNLYHLTINPFHVYLKQQKHISNVIKTVQITSVQLKINTNLMYYSKCK